MVWSIYFQLPSFLTFFFFLVWNIDWTSLKGLVVVVFVDVVVFVVALVVNFLLLL